jgi:hypothetical protein
MSAVPQIMPIFRLGTVSLSKRAKALPDKVISWVLDAHVTGDFGEVPEWREEMNWQAVLNGQGQLESAYLTQSREMVWVRTDLKLNITSVWLG